MFTAEQLRQLQSAFADQGYLHIPGAFTADEVATFSAELDRIIDGSYGDIHGSEWPEEGETTEDLLRKCVAVHFPHKVSEPIRQAISHPVLQQLFGTLLGPNVKCVQSMFFVRPAGGPGQAWHQDEHYIPSRDRSVTSAWISVDRATRSNGCLWVIPGSHKRGVLWPHEAHDDPRFDPVGEATHHPYSEADAVAVETEPGDLLVFSGYLLHRSLNNQAKTGFRRSLAFHVARAEALMPWMGAESEGPIGGADCRDFEMVCGEDAYPWKERTDALTTWLRPWSQD